MYIAGGLNHLLVFIVKDMVDDSTPLHSVHIYVFFQGWVYVGVKEVCLLARLKLVEQLMPMVSNWG